MLSWLKKFFEAAAYNTCSGVVFNENYVRPAPGTPEVEGSHFQVPRFTEPQPELMSARSDEKAPVFGTGIARLPDSTR